MKTLAYIGVMIVGLVIAVIIGALDREEGQ